VIRSAWDWTKSIVIALALFLVIRAFLVEAFKIPTSSMEETLLVGDFLLVNKAVYGAQIPGTQLRLPSLSEPRIGDVVVFNPPHDQSRNYVKRVVGLPGDTLAMRGKVLQRNRHPLDEPYVRHADENGDAIHPGMSWQLEHLVDGSAPRAYRPSRDNWGPIVVPPHRLFVLGDNRDDSEDSRYWGFVDRKAIRGRPWVVYYSFDPNAEEPFRWLRFVRWSRIGGIVR
jgi:signal peptidase I